MSVDTPRREEGQEPDAVVTHYHGEEKEDTSQAQQQAPRTLFALQDRVYLQVPQQPQQQQQASSSSSSYVLCSIRKQTSTHALLHPAGYSMSSKWDEWAPLSSLHQHNPQGAINSDNDDQENERFQVKTKAKRKSSSLQDDHEHNEENTTTTTTTTEGGGGGDTTHSHPHNHKKRAFPLKHHHHHHHHHSFMTEQDVTMNLPFTLQTVLVEEWECICRQQLLHTLPAKVPIAKVLDHFVKSHSKQQQQQQQQQQREEDKSTSLSAAVFVRELTQLLEQALPVCLLYPQERHQYHQQQQQQHLTSETSVTQIYGCEFLLRLVLRLPLLGYYSATSQKSTQTNALLQELLVLLQKNRQACFAKKSGYQKATSAVEEAEE